MSIFTSLFSSLASGPQWQICWCWNKLVWCHQFFKVIWIRYFITYFIGSRQTASMAIACVGGRSVTDGIVELVITMTLYVTCVVERRCWWCNRVISKSAVNKTQILWCHSFQVSEVQFLFRKQINDSVPNVRRQLSTFGDFNQHNPTCLVPGTWKRRELRVFSCNSSETNRKIKIVAWNKDVIWAANDSYLSYGTVIPAISMLSHPTKNANPKHPRAMAHIRQTALIAPAKWIKHRANSR